MLRTISSAVLLLGLLVCVSVASDDDEQYMVELTDDTFDDIVLGPEFIIVEFYSTW